MMKKEDNNLEGTKTIKSFMETINGAEKLVAETIKTTMKQDLFELKQYKSNSKIYEEEFLKYYSNAIEEYQQIKNLYKASNTQFQFMNSEMREPNSKPMDNNERLEFIAMVLYSFLEWKPTDPEGELQKLDAIRQVENLESIVFETQTLEFKQKVALTALQALQDKKKKKEESFADMFKMEKEKAELLISELKVKFKGIKGIQLRVLLEALKELKLYPQERKDAAFHRFCKKEFDWDIGKPQAMEFNNFKKGYTKSSSVYVESDHEKEKKEIMECLNSLIKN